MTMMQDNTGETVDPSEGLGRGSALVPARELDRRLAEMLLEKAGRTGSSLSAGRAVDGGDEAGSRGCVGG